MSTSGVHLRVVDKDNVRSACRLELEPGQEQFVAPVAVSLAQAYTEPDVAWPRLVYDGDEVVGFVMGHFDPEDDYGYLWRLNIAAGHQRKGYGRFAVREVAREAKRRGLPRLRTSYVPNEGNPAPFYDGLGFVPTGELDEGEVVLELDLAGADLD